MADFALGPADQFERAAGGVATDVDQLLVRHQVAAEAVLGERIGHFRADHARLFSLGPTGGNLLRCLLAFLLAAEAGVNLVPVLAGRVAGLAGNAGDHVRLRIDRLGGEMTVQAKAFRLQPLHAHLFRDFLRFLALGQAAVGGEVVGFLPDRRFRLVTLGAFVRADDEIGIDRHGRRRECGEDHRDGYYSEPPPTC